MIWKSQSQLVKWRHGPWAASASNFFSKTKVIQVYSVEAKAVWDHLNFVDLNFHF